MAWYSGSIAVGVKEEELNSQISHYPNPSTGKFTFNGLTDNCSLEVTDLTGKEILIKEIQGKFITISLENQAPGEYLYAVKNHSGVLQKDKLVLEK